VSIAGNSQNQLQYLVTAHCCCSWTQTQVSMTSKEASHFVLQSSSRISRALNSQECCFLSFYSWTVKPFCSQWGSAFRHFKL